MLGRNTHVVMGADADRWLVDLTADLKDRRVDSRVVQETWTRIDLHHSTSTLETALPEHRSGSPRHIAEIP